jgi:hypothetical protein
MTDAAPKGFVEVVHVAIRNLDLDSDGNEVTKDYCVTVPSRDLQSRDRLMPWFRWHDLSLFENVAFSNVVRALFAGELRVIESGRRDEARATIVKLAKRSPEVLALDEFSRCLIAQSFHDCDRSLLNELAGAVRKLPRPGPMTKKVFVEACEANSGAFTEAGCFPLSKRALVKALSGGHHRDDPEGDCVYQALKRAEALRKGYPRVVPSGGDYLCHRGHRSCDARFETFSVPIDSAPCLFVNAHEEKEARASGVTRPSFHVDDRLIVRQLLGAHARNVMFFR